MKRSVTSWTPQMHTTLWLWGGQGMLVFTWKICSWGNANISMTWWTSLWKVRYTFLINVGYHHIRKSSDIFLVSDVLLFLALPLYLISKYFVSVVVVFMIIDGERMSIFSQVTHWTSLISIDFSGFTRRQKPLEHFWWELSKASFKIH